MMVGEGRVERSVGLLEVVGREREGRVVPGRWAQAPSSVGTGMSVGKDVSVGRETYLVMCLVLDTYGPCLRSSIGAGYGAGHTG